MEDATQNKRENEPMNSPEARLLAATLEFEDRALAVQVAEAELKSRQSEAQTALEEFISARQAYRDSLEAEAEL